MSGRQAKKLRKELRRSSGAGPLGVRVRATPGGAVQIEFSRPVATVQLPAGEARRIGETLLRQAGEVV